MLKSPLMICSSNYIGWFEIGAAIIIVDYIADFMIVNPEDTFHIILMGEVSQINLW